MKRFLQKIVFFVLLLLFIDTAIGYGLDHMVRGVRKGGLGRENYIKYNLEDDILIMGSSRAWEHYNSQMISDSIGLSCYNCGEGGCSVIHSYASLLMITQRYMPKLIIYDVTPSLDYLNYRDNRESLSRLKKYYDFPGVDSIFWDLDKTERIKMISGLYRQNSSVLRNMLVYLGFHSNNTGVRGFSPVDAPFDTMKVTRKGTPLALLNNGNKIDEIKYRYLKRFIDISKRTHLILVVSPYWYGMDSLTMAPLVDLAKDNNVVLLDYSNDSKYVHQNQYFRDGIHLNAKGADEFTQDLICRIRTYIPKD